MQQEMLSLSEVLQQGSSRYRPYQPTPLGNVNNKNYHESVNVLSSKVTLQVSNIILVLCEEIVEIEIEYPMELLVVVDIIPIGLEVDVVASIVS